MMSILLFIIPLWLLIMTVKDWEKKKVAIYLRKSQGEKGSIIEQLNRIKPLIKQLEKDGKIAKVNWGIRGRSIDKSYRGTNFDGDGDVLSEGEGKSAFGPLWNREVIEHLKTEVAAGRYDAVMSESLDRISRDPMELGESGWVDLYRRKGKTLQSLTNDDMAFEPDNPTGEMIAVALLGFGKLGKLIEIEKSKETMTSTTSGTSSMDKGFIRGLHAEFNGRDTKNAGLDYRRAWELMKAAGEQLDENGNSLGIPKDTVEIAKMMGKTDWAPSIQKHKANTKWVRSWYQKMKGWDDLKVLDDWLEVVEAINQYVINLGPQQKKNFKNDVGLQRILYASKGFMGYPAGLHPTLKSQKDKPEFVIFPNPLKIGFDKLAEFKNPLDIEGFKVIRKPLGRKKITAVQSQIVRV